MNNNPSPQTEAEVISLLKLRKMIGILGIMLPIIVIVGNATLSIVAHCLFEHKFFTLNLPCNFKTADWLKPSISHYYYTPMFTMFTGTLCAVATFLFCYNGFPKNNSHKISDSVLTKMAAIGLLLVAFFPTGSENKITDNIHVFTSGNLIGIIHFAGATLFFGCLGWLSCFNFVLSSKMKEELNSLNNRKKWLRNKIYKTCGIIIFVSIALTGINVFLESCIKWQFIIDLNNNYRLTPLIIAEIIMLWAFGFSWLVKGETLNHFNDVPQ